MHFTLIKQGCPPVNIGHIGEAIILTTIGIDSPRPVYYDDDREALEHLITQVAEYLDSGYRLATDATTLDSEGRVE